MDPVSICNLALGWLGQGAITQLDVPASTTEELCARLYPEALRSVLEAAAWTFATRRLALAPAEPTGLVEFPSKYLIESTVIRVLSCDDGGGSHEIEWRREGEYVLAQTSPAVLYVKAIVLEEDATKFSPGFTRALAARLAADLAIPITENARLVETMAVKYARELSDAARLDGQQGSSERTRRGDLSSRRW